MEALQACYGDGSSDSDSDSTPSISTLADTKTCTSLPPPPITLLDPLQFLGPQHLQVDQITRIRSFPHVDGNYALHVYIPIHISSPSKKEIAAFLKKISSREPSLYVVDVDVPLNILCKNDEKLEQVALGREFHISLGRTVPLRVHQIDSMVSMLRQKLQTQHPYWIDFNKWEVFVNDDNTRTFLSVEVVQGGLVEIRKQIEAINAIYKLHNLPEFYEDPCPHISLAWALGDINHSLRKVVDEELRKFVVGKSLKNSIFSCKFKVAECYTDAGEGPSTSTPRTKFKIQLRRAGHAYERQRRAVERQAKQYQAAQEAEPEQLPQPEQPDYEEASEQHQAPPPLRLLPLFPDHRAAALLRGDDKGVLKVASHGPKIINLRLKSEHPTIRRWLEHARLVHLDYTPLGQVNHQLLSAFVERWHPETSSFHMPWGEMTVTLDDVGALLHLPLLGNVLTEPASLTYDECIVAGETYLGISRQDSILEFREHTPAYRLKFLAQMYEANMEHGFYDQAARCYILHLLGGTILADKSHQSVPARLIKLVADEAMLSRWAWGHATLVTLYDQLNYASFEDSSQFAGYATLLQCWIYEHFPTIVESRCGVHTGFPRAARWNNKKCDALKLVHFRRRIDALRLSDVVFRPYQDHRGIIPFHTMSYFRGWLVWGDVSVKYMADRVRWQLGYVQEIPVAPLDGRPDIFTILQCITHY